MEQEYCFNIDMIDCEPPASIDIQVILGGAYDSGLGEMHTWLNFYHLLPGQDPALSTDPNAQSLGVPTPAGQPYNTLPWNYNGTEGNVYGDLSTNPSATQAYPGNTVDWILVSIRESDSLATSKIWQCAGLLQSNGVVIFPNDCPVLTLDELNQYYIIVEHHSHLPIMSPALNVVSNTLTFDFTSNQSWLWEPVAGNQ